MAGSPVVVAGRTSPVANASLLSEHDEVMTVRHPDESHEKRSLAASVTRPRGPGERSPSDRV
jgi:hypothetical protein